MNQIIFDQEVLECFPVLRLRGNAGGPRSGVLKNCWEGWQVLDTSMSRWWFQIFVIFYSYLGKISNLTNIFQMGSNHHLDVLTNLPAGFPSSQH